MGEISAKLIFPFVRGRLHAIGELRAFETQLLRMRRSDSDFCKELRVPGPSSPKWMRLRNKELAPLRILSDQLGAEDHDQFEICREGDAVDAKLLLGPRQLKVQLTVTAPQWNEGGYRHYEILEALNASDVVLGYPPYVKYEGVAVGEVDIVSNEDRIRACQLGLESAISRKASFDGSGVVLAVMAQEFFIQLFDRQILNNLVDAVLEKHRLMFDALCVFDCNPGFSVLRTLKN